MRMMLNDRGQTIDEVKPGYSAEVIGMSGVPTAGDVFNIVADEKAAKQIADHRILKARQAEAGKTSRETLEDLLAEAEGGRAEGAEDRAQGRRLGFARGRGRRGQQAVDQAR
jgi:translation initiation factor IF-2